MPKSLPLLFFVLWLQAGQTEKLPVRAYTTMDGLAHGHINRMRIDSHGFLWFATDAGLSRFDGRNFFNLTTAHGLPHLYSNDLVQDKDGTFWLASDGGISRFKLQSPGSTEKPKIETFRGEENPGDRFDAIEFDAKGRLWAGARGGLYRIDRDNGKVAVRWKGWVLPGASIPRLLSDGKGGLWIATWKGAVHRDEAGRLTPVRPSPHSPMPAAQSLLQDRGGAVWIGYRSGGFCRVTAAPAGKTLEPDFCLARQGNHSFADVRSILESPDGGLWLGTTTGLYEFDPRSRSLHRYGTENGLAQEWVANIHEDPTGNLWLGTLDAGAIRLARPGFVQFATNRGSALLETPTSLLAFPGNDDRTIHALRLEEGRPRSVWTGNFVGTARGYSRHAGQGMLGDSDGNWWLSSASYLQRYGPASAGAAPPGKPEVFTLPAGRWFFALAGTRAGAIYASVTLPERDDRRDSQWLVMREPGGREFRTVTAVEPAMRRLEQDIAMGAFIGAIREDRTGALWLGLASNRVVYKKNTVTLLRYRAGAVEEFSSLDGLPRSIVGAIHFDRAGRLWIGTRAGLARSDNPFAPRPRFQTYGRAEGMASEDVWCLVEDGQGRIYAGTDRGVDRFDPASGRFRHFTPADGLPTGHVFAAARDPRGRLWFTSQSAISRFEPERREIPPPAIFLSGPSTPPVLRYDRNNFEASFSSPSLAGTPPRYQFRLKGTGHEWSAPVFDNTVRFAGLGPGGYELEARAVNADGKVSPEPAAVKFRVTPPFWRTWWFLTLALAAALAAAYAIHRYRVSQLLALERLRVRIASDLHDDIGATLSQVSMLGELAKRSLKGDNREVSGLIDRMADASREAVSAMSDIVWSIHPATDDGEGLTQRMRRFGCEMLSSRGIEFDIEISEAVSRHPLPLEARRDLLLIFKECVHNAARHARCRSLHASLDMENGGLRLSVRDDGGGFDPGAPKPGRGLATMRARAGKLGGLCRIESCPRGTRVEVTIPTAGRPLA